MDKIDELLQYIQQTNPEMTREKMIVELSLCDYSAKSLLFSFENSRKMNCIYDRS